MRRPEVATLRLPAKHRRHVFLPTETTLNAEFAIDLATAVWLGFVGACIGSFLNVVAYRVPREMSVVWKPSHCPKCNHPIRARDNVPVLGWLMLRGKCRDCGGPISPRYAIVEAVMGAAFFLLAYVELFSGGANLPGGPISPFTGAVGNVWHPHAAILSVYFYHCLAVSLLLVYWLIDQDGFQVPRKLLYLSVFLGICPPVVFDGMRTAETQLNPFLLGSTAGLSSYYWNLLGHALAAVCCSMIVARTASLSPQRVYNLTIALCIAGTFLGDNAIYRATFFAIFTGLLICHALIRRFIVPFSDSMIAEVWVAFIALLVLWPKIEALFT